MNFHHLRNMFSELNALVELLAYDLDNVGFIDFNDDLISESLICLYQVIELLEKLKQQQNGD